MKGYPMTRILLVEDDIAMSHRIGEILLEAGYKVDAAHALSRAYDFLMHPQGTYDAILSDYNLGRRSETGLEVWQFVRNSPHRPVPFIASSSTMDKWQRIIDHGDDPNFHPIPKGMYGWDDEAVLAKLTELGITP